MAQNPRCSLVSEDTASPQLHSKVMQLHDCWKATASDIRELSGSVLVLTVLGQLFGFAVIRINEVDRWSANEIPRLPGASMGS